jgi:hypothetical protein
MTMVRDFPSKKEPYIMKRQRLLVSVAAISFGLSALPVLAASSSGDTKGGPGGSATARQSCENLKGPAREACLKRQSPGTPGRSEDSASREDGRTPGRSEDSASRTGMPPRKFDSAPMGAPAAGGAPKGGGGSSTKK